MIYDIYTVSLFVVTTVMLSVGGYMVHNMVSNPKVKVVESTDIYKMYLLGLLMGLVYVAVFIFVLLKSNESKRRVDTDTLVQIAYDRGIMEGRTSIEMDLKEREAEIAIKWWTGQSNFTKARARMCENVNIKKAKK